MVLTERALKLEKKLSNQAEVADLERFTDKSEVASYAVNSVAAMVKEGLIEGSGNKVNPTGNTTKAEAAVFLYRLYNK
ncbi:Endo-1,4-beta-xylanase A precursor [compost metagenome]